MVDTLAYHRIDITADYHDWIRIGYALAGELGEQGRAYFHALSRFYPRYTPEEADRTYDYILRSAKHAVRLATIFEIAKQYGVIVFQRTA